MSFTFNKDERLCNYHTINELFAEGKSFIKYPFRVVYLSLQYDGTSPAQVLMSISKKKFKRANNRNLIRRRMKESYRLQKASLYDTLLKKNAKLAIAVIYLPTEILTFPEIDKGMSKVIAHFESILMHE